MNEKKIYDRLSFLDELFLTHKKLLIVLHNYPDPDAIASAYGLSYLVKNRYSVENDIVYGGFIGRAENRAMLTELKIKLKNINRVRFKTFNCFALVDTQPGAGNNSFPKKTACDIIIDHHAPRQTSSCKNMLIDPDVGASATILVELLKASNLSVPGNLATALAYAIKSETQDLGREASERDIKAYLFVYSLSSLPKLSKIVQPKLPRSYFMMLAKTLRCSFSFRHLIVAHIGQVEMPEMVAEMADLLLRHKNISWALCTGRFKNDLFISLRSSNPNARAGKFIQLLVNDRKNAGGHDMFAGGKVSLKGLEIQKITQLENRISDDFAKLLGYKKVHWNPIINDGIKAL